VAEPTRPAGRALVQVRLFAGARAAAGTAQESVTVDGDALVADVLELAVGAHPGLARVLPACSFLLDGVSARPEQPVGDATTLDVLPPFSGG